MNTEISKPKTRLAYIDFLKFIGLTGIIIAHVSPPDLMIMLRNFDVPFMVILSSILAQISFDRQNHNKVSVVKYYFSRFKRLVIPTWIFLGIYFTIYLSTQSFLFSVIHSLVTGLLCILLIA